MNKYYIVALVLLAAVAIGGYFYPQFSSFGATNPVGTTQGDAKFAGISVNLANPGANGTTTSILNTDGTDRMVIDSTVNCVNVGTSLTAYTGAGLSALKVTIATTSTSAPGAFNPFAPVASGSAIATSSTVYTSASTTMSTATTTFAGLWNANSYMTFAFNATNTAACTVGVHYVQM